jgi:hypothetical protein
VPRNRTAGRHVPKRNQEDWVVKELAAMRAEIAELRAERTLESASIGAGGLTVLGGDITLDGGDLLSANFIHGATGLKLDGTTGTPEFNDLILRGGIVGNDALTSPVSPAVAHAQASNFALSTTAAQKVDFNVTVPSGFTRAIALATISATAVNTTASQDTFLGYADVDFVGSPGGYLAGMDAAPGYAAGIAHTETALATSLSGTLHFRGMLQSLNASWSANAFNTVNLDALVLFLR